jgi:hypothetical protein
VAKKLNGTGKVVVGAMAFAGLLITIMGMTFRVHSATPHAGAVTTQTFKEHNEAQSAVLIEIRDDVRELRKCMIDFLEKQGDKPSH